MARIRKWKETLVLTCVTLFFSLARAWPLRPREAAHQHVPGHSLLVTGMNQKTAFGVELMARRPYIRLAHGSLVPVAMPLTAGAYTALADAPGGAPGGPAPATTTSTCLTCNTTTAPYCCITDATCCNHECPRCYRYLCVCETSGTITGYYTTCTTGYVRPCYHYCG
jgi:hypothetical protein